MENVDGYEVKVWDPLVRLFHWSLVSAVLLNAFVLEEGEQWHRWTGYLAAGWVAFRFVWGFVGSRYARFSEFWPTRQSVNEQIAGLKTGHMKTYVGHSPLGAAMMLLLCACVLSLGLSGWLMGTDLFWGEDWLEEIHETISNFLLAMAGLHAAAALLLGKLEKVNLIGAMIHGTKKFDRRD